MFREAYNQAKHFTQPVISFWQTSAGDCVAGHGSIVIVNDGGWIVTAAHLVNQALALAKSDIDARDWETRRDAIRADQSLNAKQRAKQLSALGTPHKKSVRRAATAWGHRSSKLVDIATVDAADLAVGRLDPFDPAWVATYPTFKDPTKNFSPGASLCKLGFPFFEIKPTFEEAASTFSIPPEMRSLPFFPIEGIYTRNLTVQVPAGASPFPLTFLETSSPGLRGQSGGPTFDVTGAIWAIQSQTQCLPLGFSPEVKEGGKTHKEHQILNVGMGIHVETVIGLFDEMGVDYKLSET